MRFCSQETLFTDELLLQSCHDHKVKIVFANQKRSLFSVKVSTFLTSADTKEKALKYEGDRYKNQTQNAESGLLEPWYPEPSNSRSDSAFRFEPSDLNFVALLVTPLLESRF